MRLAWLGLGQVKGGASGPSAYVVKVTSDQLLASILFCVVLLAVVLDGL
jgi:hypothetical protein